MNIERPNDHNTSFSSGSGSPKAENEQKVQVEGKIYSLSPKKFIKFVQYGKQIKELEGKLHQTSNQGEIKKLEAKIQHLAHKKENILNKVRFPKNFLVPSRNVIHLDFYENDDTPFVQASHQLIQKMVEQKTLPPSALKAMNFNFNGICLGACIDFSSEAVHLFDRQPPLTDKEFEQAVINIANKYRKGIPARGVATQSAYLEAKKAESQQKPIDVLEGKLSQSNNLKEKAFETTVAKTFATCFLIDPQYVNSTAGKELIENLFKGELKLPEQHALRILFSEFSENPSIPLDDHLVSLEEKLQELKLEKGDKAYEGVKTRVMGVMALLQHIENDYKENLPQALKGGLENQNLLNRVSEQVPKQSLGIRDRARAKFSQIKEKLRPAAPAKPIVEGRTLLHLQVLSHLDDASITRVAEARDLEAKPVATGAFGTQGDRAFLANLANVEDGVYTLSFLTEDSGAHETLFIKRGNQAYSWDPNKGLIRCGVISHAHQIMQIVQTYEPSSQITVTEIPEKQNHHLHMLQLIPKKQQMRTLNPLNAA